MGRRYFLLGIGWMLGLVMGLAFSAVGVPFISAQGGADDRTLVEGSGIVDSSLRPPKDNMSGHFTMYYQPLRSFKIVPAGKRFVVTDIQLHDRGSVRQPLTVNLARANPKAQTGDIMVQIPYYPGTLDRVQLCTGYLVPSGHALVAWTNAGIEPHQVVNISVTGYLEDEPRP